MNRSIIFVCVLFLVGVSPVYAGHHHYHGYSHGHSHGRHHSGSSAALGFLGGFIVGNMVHRPPPPRVVYTTPYYQSPAEQAFLSQSGFVRRQLQARLQQMGFYYSYVDGVWGPATQNALENYAANSGNLHLLTSYAGANEMMRMLLRY